MGGSSVGDKTDAVESSVLKTCGQEVRTIKYQVTEKNIILLYTILYNLLLKLSRHDQ